MKKYEMSAIGEVCMEGEMMKIQVLPEYVSALQGIDGFRHLQIIWWFHKHDKQEYRMIKEMPQPYKHAPEVMGVFATRSPIRPNPIAISTVEVLHIEYQNGTIYIPYMDADNGTPVLDIKPYTPSIDRIEHPGVPEWCANWPDSYEASGNFAWEDVFNFE